MTSDKVSQLLDLYTGALGLRMLPLGSVSEEHREQIVLLLNVISHMREMLRTSVVEKGQDFDYAATQRYHAKRNQLLHHLGFIQGALCAWGMFRVDEILMHNRGLEGLDGPGLADRPAT